MGTAGRAQAHSPPGPAALKSEPGAARLVRRAGPAARAPPRVRGRRWGGARRLPGRSETRPRVGARHPLPAFGLRAGASRAFGRRAAGRGRPGASRGTHTPDTAGAQGVPGAPCLGRFQPRHRSSDSPPEVLWLLLQVARCHPDRVPEARLLGVVVSWSSGNLFLWGWGPCRTSRVEVRGVPGLRCLGARVCDALYTWARGQVQPDVQRLRDFGRETHPPGDAGPLGKSSSPTPGAVRAT